MEGQFANVLGMCRQQSAQALSIKTREDFFAL